MSSDLYTGIETELSEKQTTQKTQESSEQAFGWQRMMDREFVQSWGSRYFEVDTADARAIHNTEPDQLMTYIDLRCLGWISLLHCQTDNGIGAEGAGALSDALKVNTTLTTLDLYS